MIIYRILAVCRHCSNAVLVAVLCSMLIVWIFYLLFLINRFNLFWQIYLMERLGASGIGLATNADVKSTSLFTFSSFFANGRPA